MCMPSMEVDYEDTWPYMIITKYPNILFIDKNKRSPSARRLITEGALSKGYDLLEYYKPDFVITHLGITDCAPRLLKREALYTKIINQLPFSKLVYDFVRKTKGRTISCCDISSTTFYNCFAQYAERAKKINTQVFCVKIAHVGDGVVKKSPHINESVDLFNQEFDRLEANFDNVKTIDPFPVEADLREFYTNDEIHMNLRGTEIMFSRIVKAIEPYLNSITE